MPRGRVLTEETKKKIQKLIIVGLSDTEIGAALKISSDVVHKLRKNTGGKKDGNGRRSIKNNGSEKTDRDGGAETSGDSIDRKESREPEHHNSDDHTAGEGKITFTGGKKHQQGGKTDKEGKEEFDWKCPKCGHEWNGSADECPQCKTKLQE